MIVFSWSRREKILASALAVVIILFLTSLFWNKKTADPMEAALKNYEQEGQEGTQAVAKEDAKSIVELWVDVKGAIHKPGIYKLKANARVFEAIQQAGGAVVNADINQINLAQIVEDGMVLYIPAKGEAPNQFTGQSNANTSPSSSGSVGKINVNTATEQELETLPGIGPAKAQRIIQYRNDHGSFASVEDLKKISGLGEKTISRFKDRITAG